MSEQKRQNVFFNFADPDARAPLATTEIDLKTPLQGKAPQELIAELKAMRRNPGDFYLRGRGSCSLGCDRKGERSTYQIGHAKSEEAGTWCAVHGWLTFDSAACPPTERLSPLEVVERFNDERKTRLRAKRARGHLKGSGDIFKPAKSHLVN